jgi:hypothetical protein
MEIRGQEFLLSQDDMKFVLEMIDQGIINNSISDFTLRILAKSWYDRGYEDAKAESEDAES